MTIKIVIKIIPLLIAQALSHLVLDLFHCILIDIDCGLFPGSLRTFILYATLGPEKAC